MRLNRNPAKRVGWRNVTCAESVSFTSTTTNTTEKIPMKYHPKNNHVRIYDFGTKRITEIPTTELGPNYVRSTVQGIDGEVFVDGSKARMSDHLRHPPFDESLRELMRQFASVFTDVYKRTPEEWELGFRREMHPEREIELWRQIMAAYLEFTHGNTGPVDVKKDCFNILLNCSINGCDVALETASLQRLSRAQARDIVNAVKARLKGETRTNAESSLRKLVGGNISPLSIIETDAGRKALMEAEIIVALDSMGSNDVLLIGQDRLAEVVRSGLTRVLQTRAFEYEGEAELAYLERVIKEVRGSEG